MDALQNSPCRMQVDLDNLWNRSTLFFSFFTSFFQYCTKYCKRQHQEKYCAKIAPAFNIEQLNNELLQIVLPVKS